MWATMLRFKLQVCIIRWSNQKMKVAANFPGSYNSPRQFTSYIILVHSTSWRPKYEDQEALGNSGDTGFEVLDFRTSGHFGFFTTFLVAGTCSCLSVNDCKFRLFKAYKRESSNLLLIRKWPEVLKSRTFNSCVPWASWSLCSGPLEALGTRMELYLKTEIYQPTTNFPPIIHIRFPYLIKCFIQVQGPLSIFWIGEASLRVLRVQREPKSRVI